MEKKKKFAAELEALGTVLESLESLDELQQKWVLQTVAERLNIKSVTAIHGVTVNPQVQGGTPKPHFQESEISPKDFMKVKKPANAVQAVACLAYYLTHHRNTPHFNTKNITALNTEAARSPFANAARDVNNATYVTKYLTPAAKAKKQISALGEDIVNALPDQAVVASLQKENRPSKKKTRKKKRSGKSTK